MKRVVVAMSGGVDSSVAAALLRERGLDVRGVTFDFRCGFGAEGDGPGAAAARAASVAKSLGIPHRTVALGERFREEVLAPAWDEYAAGRTPSPCVSCNPRLKIRALLEAADADGAELAATGHYARIALDEKGAPCLRRGADRDKDQSYFLFGLDAAQLRRLALPLGDLAKADVRATARRLGLEVADQAESQDFCLAAAAADGLAEELRVFFGGAPRPGAFVDPAGSILGRHAGVHRFTVGQRKGVGLAFGSRAYVTRIDAVRGDVVVSPDEKDLLAAGLVASRVCWTGGTAPSLPLECEAQIRYRHRAVAARVEWEADAESGRIAVGFETPQKAVAPGQAVVLYEGDRVIGGATIDAARPQGAG